MNFDMTANRVVLVAICLGYFVIILITNRGLIAAPRYRLLRSQIKDLRDRACIMIEQAGAEPHARSAYVSILMSLNNLKGSKRHPVLERLGWVFNVPLTKLVADIQRLNALQRRLVHLVPGDELSAYAEPILLKLSALDQDTEQRLRTLLGDATTPATRRIIEGAHKLVHEREEEGLAAELENTRITLWLAIVGLCGIIAVGIALGHEQTMLLGALGGFLAPAVTTLTGKRASSSWGVMVLSPVGGALTAVGGLLLVRFLSDPRINILGSVFLDNSWDAPYTPIALALALLFGFSGRLFSSMAISATAQFDGTNKTGDA
ncbi:hypothetical protein RHA1_ro09143 (plasmid) [Rhodococcus jostii RHA1]|uniref:Uncharacterized protein n=2 Tax=Rhodococcus jostii TaxID=132919 RepID=Q0RX00_RHOJR|nr:hypothetical protein RHA1_ro09143 [Rhodococcus jostii RHA1]